MSQVLDVRTVVVSPTLPPLQGVQLSDGQVGATLRSLCSALRLNPNSQRKRIARTASLRMALRSATLATAGGLQEMDVLMAWIIPYWTLGIQVDRLDAAKRTRVLIIQTQAVEALYRAFSNTVSNVIPPTEQVIESQIVSSSDLNLPLEARVAELERIVRNQESRHAREIAALTKQAKAIEQLLAAAIQRIYWLQEYIAQRDNQQEQKPQRRRRGRPRRAR